MQTISCHRPARAIAALGLFMFLTLAARAGLASDALRDDLVPDPSLSPADVVRAQLEALRHNDAEDRGVEVAFRFASPANRQNTGPVERFGRMLRAGQYALMFNYRDAVFDTVEIRGNQARLRVVLIGTNRTVRYDFYLGLQTAAPYENCWMTEAVSAVPVGGAVALDTPTATVAMHAGAYLAAHSGGHPGAHPGEA